jgi:hypothetical protein
VVVQLSSSDGSLASPTPINLSLAPGATTGTFSVTTRRPTATTIVTIMGTLNGVTKSANVTLRRN